MRLGILGGTFDPVHLGHLILAEWASGQLALDRVLFVPAGLPWRKAERRIESADHRIAMLRLAIAGNPLFEVLRLEAEHEGPSYTVETLQAVAAERPQSELFFVLGQDALADLPNWHQPERILELATLAVARRSGQGSVSAEDVERGLSGSTDRLVWLSMPLFEISASLVRERVHEGLSIRYLVPEAVEAYIREHKLYGS